MTKFYVYSKKHKKVVEMLYSTRSAAEKAAEALTGYDPKGKYVVKKFK